MNNALKYAAFEERWAITFVSAQNLQKQNDKTGEKI